MDLIDLADPIRLLILLLPERYRGPAAALITALVAAQGIAASIVARLPLAAARDPRWGRVVRALHWYSLLRFRDEKGTTKRIGAEIAPRVTVAPPSIALPAEKQGAIVVSETRSHDAALRALGPVVVDPRKSDPPPSFDPSVRQTIAPEVAADVQRAAGSAHPAQVFSPAFRDPDDGQRGSVDVRALLAVVVALSVALPLGVALCGCPRTPPVSGCQPEAQTCIDDRPHVCSASQRWHRAGDLQCSAVGGVCTVMGGRAYCAPVADAGADAGGVE